LLIGVVLIITRHHDFQLNIHYLLTNVQRPDMDATTQGKGFSCVMSVLVAAMLVLAAKTAYDYWYYWNDPVTGGHADAKAEAYFAERSVPFCAFEGVWHDWERDETITLSCLEVKGDSREGSYSSAMGASSDLEFLDERHLRYRQ